MDFEELRTIRAQAIAEMQYLLDRTESTNMPAWALYLVITPIYLFTAIHMTLSMLWSLVKGWIQSPFDFTRVWVDIMVIMYWFFHSAIQRMKRK